MKPSMGNIQARVRVHANPQIRFDYSYFDLFPQVAVEVSEYMKDGDRRDILKLVEPDLEEFGYLDVEVDFSIENFIKIQDKLNIAYGERLKELTEGD